MGPVADNADLIRVSCALGAVNATAIMDESALAVARPIVVKVALGVLGLQQGADAAS